MDLSGLIPSFQKEMLQQGVEQYSANDKGWCFRRKNYGSQFSPEKLLFGQCRS